MSSKRSWHTYPDTYRAEAMQTLAQWVQTGESGSIIGLPGAGKSNLLGFLCHRPEAMVQYLPDDFGRLALIHVDLNNLPDDSVATFFRIILRSLFEAKLHLATIDEALAEAVETLYRKVEDKTDAFLTQSALREALFLFQDASVRLALIFDPFDQFYRTAPTPLLDNLRGLRDKFKSTLSYMVGVRHELTYLRDPADSGELFEIVDIHQCWLGAMSQEGARWVVHQVEAATRHSFDPDHTQQLIQLTGGYPALLRAASLWLAHVSPVPDMTEWAEILFAQSSIQNRLADLREGLTGEEEATLSMIQQTNRIKSNKERRKSFKQIARKYEEALLKLQQKRLCHRTEEVWTLMCPLLEKYIDQMEGVSAGKIRYEARTDQYLIGDQPLTGLAPRDRQLLNHFLAQPRVAHSIDALAQTVWVDDEREGVTDEAVQQAIRHLRKQIEPNPAKPTYLVTQRGAGYRFFPEGAPAGQ